MWDFNYRSSYKLLLASIPLIGALVLLTPLVINEHALTIGQAGVQLAPVRDNSAIVLSLLGFMIGYIALLGLFFSKDVKEWFHHMHAPAPLPMRHVTVRKRK